MWNKYTRDNDPQKQKKKIFHTDIALQSSTMDKDPPCISKELRLMLWVRIPFMARCIRYNIMWYILSVTCDRSVSFSGYSGFLHQYNWPPQYSWNIVEIGIKHHKASQRTKH